MKKLLAVALFAMCAPVLIRAQASLSDDSIALKALSVPVPIEGGQVWVTVVTDKTAKVLWRDAPAGESIRSDAANSGLVLYVMGIATKDFELTPQYSIQQDGKSIPGKAINIRNLSGGAVKRGESLLGLIVFHEKVDLSRPFTLNLCGGSVEVSLRADDLKQWGALSRQGGPGSSASPQK